MRLIHRRHGVILASLGVLLGVMLALSPGGALATSFDVLTIGGTDYPLPLTEPQPSQRTVILALNPGEQPAPPQWFQLAETDPLTGNVLVDFAGDPIISDTLTISSTETGPDQFAQIFTLASDSDPNEDISSLIIGATFLTESRGGNFIGSFGSLGQVFVTSDIDDASNVPEPSTWLLLLLGCGVAGLAAWQQTRESELQ
jgi:hypothetical protein